MNIINIILSADIHGYRHGHSKKKLKQNDNRMKIVVIVLLLSDYYHLLYCKSSILFTTHIFKTLLLFFQL